MSVFYTVTFDACGGAAPYPATLVLPENSLAYGTLAATARAGYVFLGWWTSAEGGTLVTAATGPVPNMDHTLHAQWAAAVTVVYAPMGGSAPVPSGTVVYGVPCVYSPMPVTARAGCGFHGWFGVDGTRVDEYDAVAAANHTLYAVWTVTVTFGANGGGGLTVGSRDYVLPNTYGVFPGVTREGYTLTGWWTAASGGARAAGTAAVAAGDHTLYAQWVPTGEVPVTPAFEVTADGEWVYFDVDVVAVNLPGGLQESYDAWLTPGERIARLTQLLNGILQDFRGAVDAASHAVGGADATLLPMPCQRHALMTVWYFLGLDVGYGEAHELRQGWQDSEVYLRSLLSDLRKGVNRFGDGGGGTPRYAAGAAEHMAAGGRYSRPSAGGGYVNYGI